MLGHLGFAGMKWCHGWLRSGRIAQIIGAGRSPILLRTRSPSRAVGFSSAWVTLLDYDLRPRRCAGADLVGRAGDADMTVNPWQRKLASDICRFSGDRPASRALKGYAGGATAGARRHRRQQRRPTTFAERCPPAAKIAVIRTWAAYLSRRPVALYQRSWGM